MLVDDKSVMRVDPIMALVAAVNGNSGRSKRLQQGIYERGDFGSYPWRPGYKDAEFGDIGPNWRDCYGVCDNAEQILSRYPELTTDPNRRFVVMMTPVRRADQSPSGGWRWHKWGEYIGTYEPKHEYLYDEDIEQVYCFHIYEQI